MGLDPGSPGSHPRPKVALNLWATGAARTTDSLNKNYSIKQVFMDPFIKNLVKLHFTIVDQYLPSIVGFFFF